MEKTILCLLVDDDPDDQEIFCLALQEIGKNLECIIANGGNQALEMLNSNKALIPDFIFIDVNMPGMNGIDCLKHIKDLEHLKESEVIMYSTTSSQKIIEKSKGSFQSIVVG